MKRAAVASAALLAVATLLTGCQKEEVEKLVAPIVADVQETPEATEVEEEKSPLIPEIDDTPVSYTHLDVYKRQIWSSV